ncbi:DUF3108 domain-containing protein [Aliikangiella coralliicola]|uniref:DUF3108 domain-containing protein n=1 Tax=Aliikangiella coralliicola TaxID=2592383 RepID=A0A545UC44_9GAMM|nr:DUF3108 domain-containing protein [Aliikangiella coralliicola]TQV87027.1 DUF3108 domain-containing protein [Aliikangiella coralliicola]
MVESLLNIPVLLAVSASTATSFPLSFTSVYEGSEYAVLNGEARIEFVRSNNYIKYSLKAKGSLLFFSVHKTYDCSVLKIEGDSIVPLEYLHTDSKESKNNVKTIFDWNNKTITTTRGLDRVSVLNDVDSTLWDPLSAQVYLMKLASSQTVGFTHDYQVIEKGRVNPQQAHFEKMMKYETEFKELDTLKVVSKADVGGGTLWLAKNYAWIPAAIEIDGITIELKSEPIIVYPAESSSQRELVESSTTDLIKPEQSEPEPVNSQAPRC